MRLRDDKGGWRRDAVNDATARRIVDDCYDRVLAYCRRHAPEGVDPRDVAQEAFLRLVRSGSMAEVENPLGYLVSVARNLCVDAYRSPRAQTLPLDEGCEVADPRDELGDVELALALGRLGPDLREVVELRFDQGLTAVEAARVLGVSRFTVARRLKRALAILEDELVFQSEGSEGSRASGPARTKRARSNPACPTDLKGAAHGPLP